MCRIWVMLMVGVLSVGAAPSAKDLAGVPAAELPGRAAALVKEAEEKERVSVAIAAVEVTNESRPAALTAVVEAIAKAAPRAAAAAAGKASALQSSNAVAIARVAAAGAPEYGPSLVSAICPHAPGEFSEIAIEIANAAPHLGHSIVFALNDAVPSLRDYVERAKSNVQSGRSNRPSVALLLYETEEIIEAEGEGSASDVIRKLHLEKQARSDEE